MPLNCKVVIKQNFSLTEATPTNVVAHNLQWGENIFSTESATPNPGHFFLRYSLSLFLPIIHINTYLDATHNTETKYPHLGFSAVSPHPNASHPHYFYQWQTCFLVKVQHWRKKKMSRLPWHFLPFTVSLPSLCSALPFPSKPPTHSPAHYHLQCWPGKVDYREKMS